LREMQVAEVDVFTKAENSYKKKAAALDGPGNKGKGKKNKDSGVNFRGFAVRINHAEGVAGTYASDAHLMDYLTGEDEKQSLETLEKF
jgi:hypothetical protein